MAIIELVDYIEELILQLSIETRGYLNFIRASAL